METVTNFIFLGLKITADGDCSHEIKRRLPLGRKAVTYLDTMSPSCLYRPFQKGNMYSTSPLCIKPVQQLNCQCVKLDIRQGEDQGALRKESALSSFSAAAADKLPQLCPTLCDPRDGIPPGSPVPGILQARTLEWVAISFSNA